MSTAESVLTYQAGTGAEQGARPGEWKQTWSGGRYYPLDPRPEDIDLLDIVFALGNLARYTGHTSFYSVAEHSILVSKLVEPEHALTALLHDATEAYLNDISRPVKRTLGRDNLYFQLEDACWEKALAPKFGLPIAMPQEVLDGDARVLGLEKAVLLPRSDPWVLPFPVPTGVRIRCYEPAAASWLFLERYARLTGIDCRPLIRRYDEMVREDLDCFNRQFNKES